MPHDVSTMHSWNRYKVQSRLLFPLDSCQKNMFSVQRSSLPPISHLTDVFRKQKDNEYDGSLMFSLTSNWICLNYPPFKRDKIETYVPKLNKLISVNCLCSGSQMGFHLPLV